MTARFLPSVEEIVARYAAGYFPLYDVDDRFYWERLAVRAVLPVNEETVTRALAMGRRAKKKFEIRYTSAVEKVIETLRDPRVKERTWVRSEVVAIYRALFAGGFLQTVEAWNVKTGKLGGALLGLVLPGTFVAETMFSLEADASKVCLCQLVTDAAEAGHRMIDVQTPHHWEMLPEFDIPIPAPGATAHPCIRLGEKVLGISTFMRLFRAAARERFSGTLEEWVDVGGLLARTAKSPADARGMLELADRGRLLSAWRMLRNNFPAEARAAIDAVIVT